MIKTLSFPPEIFKMKMAENENKIVMAYPEKLGMPGDRLKVSNDKSIWQIDKIFWKTPVSIYASTYYLEAGFHECVDSWILVSILNALYGNTVKRKDGSKFKWAPDLYPHYLVRIPPGAPEMNFSLRQWGIK